MIGRTISHYEIIEQLGEGGPNYARASLGRLVPRSLLCSSMPEIIK